MNTVGNRLNRYLIYIYTWPEELPHTARNIAMQGTYSVMLTRQAQGQDCHTICWPPTMILTGNIEKLVPGQSQLTPIRTKISVDQVIGERVVACWHRGMCCKQRIRSHDFAGFSKGQSLHNKFAAALQIKKSCVPFIEMPGSRGNTQCPQCSHTTNTKNNLLRDPHITVTAIEPSGKFAIGWRIWWHICVHKIEWNTPNLNFPDLGVNLT